MNEITQHSWICDYIEVVSANEARLRKAKYPKTQFIGLLGMAGYFALKEKTNEIVQNVQNNQS